MLKLYPDGHPVPLHHCGGREVAWVKTVLSNEASFATCSFGRRPAFARETDGATEHCGGRTRPSSRWHHHAPQLPDQRDENAGRVDRIASSFQCCWRQKPWPVGTGFAVSSTHSCQHKEHTSPHQHAHAAPPSEDSAFPAVRLLTLNCDYPASILVAASHPCCSIATILAALQPLVERNMGAAAGGWCGGGGGGGRQEHSEHHVRHQAWSELPCPLGHLTQNRMWDTAPLVRAPLGDERQ